MTTHEPSATAPSDMTPATLVLHVGALAVGLYSVHAGWLTLPQICLTLMVELMLVVHFAARRTVRSEGVITRDRMGSSSNTFSVSLDRGGHLSPSQRWSHALIVQLALSAFIVGITWKVAPEVELDVLDALSTLGWAGFTLGVLASETISYRAWVRSGAAATADPGSHLSVPIARVLTYSFLLWALQSYGLLENPTGALLILMIGDALARILIGWRNVPTPEEEALTKVHAGTRRRAGHRRRPGAAKLPVWAQRLKDRATRK